ncbi:MAG: GNAT family N-acetyltransferase [Bacillota bacterium]
MDCVIKMYERPSKSEDPVVEQINQLIISLTGVWFTNDVAEDTLKDLFFQDVLCAEVEGRVTSFIIFTSSEGSISISLMGTHPNQHRNGFGSLLMHHLIEHVKSLGFTRIVALTVPPKFKPSYQQTVDFYEKHGFHIEKEYTELWHSGTIQLVKSLC